MRSRLSTLRLCHAVTNWRIFATWLDGRGITGLAQVSTQALTDYSIYLSRTRKVSRNTAPSHLVALTRLHVYAPYLPAGLRIGVPDWESEDVDDYLPAATAAGQNATEPISSATMGPLLVWALKFTEEFAADILAARDEERRMRQVIGRHLARPLPHGPRPVALAAWFTPGGGVEDGEDLASTAARESQEETGLAVSPQDLRLVILTMPRRQRNRGQESADDQLGEGRGDLAVCLTTPASGRIQLAMIRKPTRNGLAARNSPLWLLTPQRHGRSWKVLARQESS